MKFLNYSDNPNESEKPLVTDQDTIRIFIGLLGFFLPLILWGGLFLYTEPHYAKPLGSISHYYYSRVSSVFAITLGILALVLFVYRGKQPVDFWLSALAALSALCVIIFPTNMNLDNGEQKDYYVTLIDDNPFRGVFHFAAATVFLFLLALMSFFRFPRNDSSDEQPKWLDKFMYRTCGIVMVLAMITIALGVSGYIGSKDWFTDRHGIFWGETIAVCAFGYSWLLKAGFFTKTKNLLTRSTEVGE